MCTMPVSSTAGALGGPSPSQTQSTAQQLNSSVPTQTGGMNGDLVAALQSLLQMLTQLITNLSGSPAQPQQLQPAQPNSNQTGTGTGSQTPSAQTQAPANQTQPSTSAPTNGGQTTGVAGATGTAGGTPPPPPAGTTNGLPPSGALGGPAADLSKQTGSGVDGFAAGWASVVGPGAGGKLNMGTAPASVATGANLSSAPPTPTNSATPAANGGALSGYQGLVAAVGGASSDATGGYGFLIGAGVRSGVAAGGGPSPLTNGDIAFSTPANRTSNSSSDVLRTEGFIWKGQWYHQIAPIGGNMTDLIEVELRVSKSVLQHMIEDEKIDDFALNRVSSHRATAADGNLLKVNPNAMWVSEVAGTMPDGQKKTIPVVTNFDGSTWVDPVIRFR